MNEESVLQSLGGSYAPTTTAAPTASSGIPKKKTFVGNILKGAKDVGVGFVKGAGETLGSVAKNVEKVVKDVETTKQTNNYAGLLGDINSQNDKILALMKTLPVGDPKRLKYADLLKQNQAQASTLHKDFYGEGGVQESVDNAGMTNTIDKLTTATNSAQKFGKGAEKVAEFVVGGNAASKLVPSGTTAATRIAANTAKGFAGGFIPTVANSASKGQFDTAEGAKNALGQATTAGVVGGAVSGVISGGAEALKASGLPSKLMSSVYKTDKKEIAQIFNHVDDAAGTPQKGERLSDWALNHKIKGNLENQAKQVSRILKESEDKVISSAEAAKVKIPVPENLFKMAQGIQKDFQGIGRGEIAGQADDFLRAVKDNSVSVKDAIKFRRLIDNTLRTKSSFNNPSLADNLAYWADDLRKAINSVDEIGAVNKDYSQAIRAREALISAATKAENSQALGALEAYVIGGGAMTGTTAPALATVISKRLTQSPSVTSKLANTIQNGKMNAKIPVISGMIAGDAKRNSQEKKTLEELLGR